MKSKIISRMFRMLLLALLPLAAQAQWTYTLDQQIPVQVNGLPLALAWTGGLNAAQTNTMDLNQDGKDDLVIFDRTAQKVITFLRVTDHYVYAPQYEGQFPETVNSWMLLRDFNCDGRKDLFTSDPFGISVFVNTTTAGKPLSWRPFNPGHPLLEEGLSGTVNLKINANDIPAIDDIDGDGDLDILGMRFVGIGTVEYYQNMSIERAGKCDSLQLKLITQNWGNFEECSCGRFAFGVTCASLPGGRTEHVGGKTLLTLDLDHDGDRELLFSEESCTQVYVMTNQGDATNALFTAAAPFPITNPASILNFPAPFFEDVDGDGLRDLLVSPNVYNRLYFNTNFQQSLWYYRNTGSATQPAFSFVRKNFLQSDMIDVGDNAVPAFADADGDGDLDLFVGCNVNTNANARGSIFQFENTGSFAQPAFKLVTDDFLGFASLNFYNLRPRFADTDANGTLDLVVSATDMGKGTTGLYVVPNDSKTRIEFSNPVLNTITFSISENDNYDVHDINRDGLVDVVKGAANGALEYWENTGTAGTPDFTKKDPAFLGMTSSTSRQNPSIFIADLNGDGKDDAVVGDQQGALTVYDDINAKTPVPNTVSIYDSITSQYLRMNLGGRVFPAAANLYNGTHPVLVVGNALGGLYVLKNVADQFVPTEPNISLYPNPVAGSLQATLKILADRPLEVEFFTLLGQRVSGTGSIAAHTAYEVNVSAWPRGMYLARFYGKGTLTTLRFIVE